MNSKVLLAFITNKDHRPILIAFAVSWAYWLFFFLTSRMVLADDAIGYEQIGRLLQKEPWVHYFTTGPNREPLYPLLISLAMRIADACSVDYQSVLKIFHMLILFSTQCLTLVVLRKLNIRPLICAFVIFYLGISPAVVNSCFSLYSEIATYPWALGIVLTASYIWQSLIRSPKISIFRYAGLGFALGMLLLGITFIKGIFELITPLFLFAFLLLGLQVDRNKRTKILANIFILLAVLLVTYHTPLHWYKMQNKKYNGFSTMTNRGPTALYGNTFRRMEPLTTKRLLTALAYAPGEGICLEFFSENECVFWSFKTSDAISSSKGDELYNKGLSNQEIYDEMIVLSKQKVLENPLQYAFLTALEGTKMLFWESTKIGYVEYPQWLAKFLHNTIIKNGLRSTAALLTLLALCWALVFLWRNRKRIAGPEGTDDEPVVLVFMMMLLIAGFIGAYSIFYILTRYAFTIVPLYLALIAFALQNHFLNKKR